MHQIGLVILVGTAFQATITTTQVNTQFKINPLCDLAKQICPDCGIIDIIMRGGKMKT